MKFKSVLICIAAVALLGLAACSPAATAKEVPVEVSCNDFSRRQHISLVAEVAAGDSLKVTLCSNPTTGFNWSENLQISDPTVLKQTGHEFISPESTPPPPPGTPGQEVWTFEALKSGTSTVSLEYSRPWEGGEKGEWILELTVTVK